MRWRCLIGSAAIATVAVAGGCDKQDESAGAVASGRCPHEIKTELCPFCNEELIQSEGFCGAHAVAEALCATCRPYLKAAFRAQGDWCDAHAIPESQCLVCNPELQQYVSEGHGGEIPDGHPHAPGDTQDNDNHDGHDHTDDDGHDHG